MREMTVLDLVQAHVDNTCIGLYSDDQCPPVFLVSIMDKKMILTIRHMNQGISVPIEPDSEIRLAMEYLYNSTM